MQDSLLEPSALECTICLERMRDVSFLVTSPDEQGNVCCHWFCTDCITPLAEKAKQKGKAATCPSCRREILSIVRSRYASELCYEVEKERQLSKQLQKDKQQLEAKFKTVLKEKTELDTNHEKLKKQHTTKCEELEKEVAILLQQKEKMKKENQDMKLSYETQITRLQMQLQELSESVMLSKQDSQRAQSVLLVERKQSEELGKQLQKVQAELEAKTEDAEKYQRLYSRTLQELNSKQFNANDKPKDATQAANEGYLKSWLSSPKFDFSSSTSYLSNISLGGISYYLKPTRTGPLLRQGSDFLFVERRGSSKVPTVWKVAVQQPYIHKGRTVAAKKILDSNTKKNIVDAYREAMLLWKFDHQNILKVECVLRDEFVPTLNNLRGDFIVFPFVEYDLEYILSDPFTRKQMDEGQIRSIMFQVLSALYFLHSANVVHRDIKPTSILMDDKGHVKLGSFGSAVSLLDETAPCTPFGPYTPPENCYLNTANSVSGSSTVGMSSKPMDHWKAGDIWMLAMVLIEMNTRGTVLFDSKDRMTLLPKIFSVTESKPTPQDMFKQPFLNGVIPSEKEVALADWLLAKRVDVVQGNNPFLNGNNVNIVQSNRYTMSLDCLQLIKAMIHFDPGKRLSAKECLEHSYFTSAKMVDVHRTCLLAAELTADDVQKFVIQNCGGL